MALDASKIENERKALMVLAEAVQNCSDEERPMLMEEIKKTAEKLQSLCDELQAEADQMAAALPQDEELNVVVEIVLTPDQRKRVLEATGVDVPSVKIPDPDALLTKNMQHVEPEFIEMSAMEQAKRFKSMVEDANIDVPEEEG